MKIEITGTEDETTKEAMARAIYSMCQELGLTTGMSIKEKPTEIDRTETHSIQIYIGD